MKEDYSLTKEMDKLITLDEQAHKILDLLTQIETIIGNETQILVLNEQNDNKPTPAKVVPSANNPKGINPIVTNLEHNSNVDVLDNGFEMVEEMSKTKEKLTDDVESIEKDFESLYYELKPFLNDPSNSNMVKSLQSNIKNILTLKSAITMQEKSNMDMINRRIKNRFGQIEIPKSRSQIIDSYKQH